MYHILKKILSLAVLFSIGFLSVYLLKKFGIDITQIKTALIIEIAGVKNEIQSFASGIKDSGLPGNILSEVFMFTGNYIEYIFAFITLYIVIRMIIFYFK